MKSLAFIACLTILGITGCATVPPATTARATGRRMTEEQVLASATALMPPQPGDSYHVNFKDGVWRVVCLSSVPARNGRTVTVRDADGKAVLENQYLNLGR